MTDTKPATRRRRTAPDATPEPVESPVDAVEYVRLKAITGFQSMTLGRNGKVRPGEIGVLPRGDADRLIDLGIAREVK
jgi:hypothetical protein